MHTFLNARLGIESYHLPGDTESYCTRTSQCRHPMVAPVASFCPLRPGAARETLDSVSRSEIPYTSKKIRPTAPHTAQTLEALLRVHLAPSCVLRSLASFPTLLWYTFYASFAKVSSCACPHDACKIAQGCGRAPPPLCTRSPSGRAFYEASSRRTAGGSRTRLD